jgi:hypothetical protein
MIAPFVVAGALVQFSALTGGWQEEWKQESVNKLVWCCQWNSPKF